MILLSDRAIIGVSGNDKHDFLQGLITNDIHKVDENNIIYAAMLTPQGKYLFDFFIYLQDDTFLIDCEKARLPEFLKKLKMYKLRAKVEVKDLSENYFIYSSKDTGINDPRNESLGKRLLSKQKQNEDGKLEDYKTAQFQLAIPDSADFIPDKTFILQFKFEELNGVDYEKGCYVGQEVTARTHYKGTVRKSLYKVEAEEKLPEFGTEISFDGKKIGQLLTSNENIGIALCEIDAVSSNNDFSVDNLNIRLTA